tara:strand:- start:4370 stop:5281 length:912 start_codon:yes stop_codon:yes gene_type:complete
MNPFFSVIIPTYNQDVFLQKAIQSVLDQTFKKFEIIVVDNFSQDNTENIVKNFDKRFIKYIKINNNGVIAKSRNVGIRESKGRWVAFLDSDDKWFPERLMILHDFIEKNNFYEIICTDEYIIDKVRDIKRIWRYGPYKKDFYKFLLKYGNCISTSATIANKKFIFNNNIYFNESEEFAPQEDYDFFLNLARKNAKFKFLHKILGEHLFHKESWGERIKDKRKKSLIAVIKNHIYKVQNFTDKKSSLWSFAYSRLIIDDIRDLFYSGELLKALSLSIKLFINYPVKSVFHFSYKLRKKFFTSIL